MIRYNGIALQETGSVENDWVRSHLSHLEVATNKEKPMHKMISRRSVLMIFPIALALVTAVYFLQGATTMNFDQDEWADTESYQNEPYVRLGMIKDLMRNQLTHGMTKSEVIKLLGPPTETEKFGEYDLVYWLGMEKGFISIDSSWLVLRFDADHKLEDYKTLND